MGVVGHILGHVTHRWEGHCGHGQTGHVTHRWEGHCGHSGTWHWSYDT